MSINALAIPISTEQPKIDASLDEYLTTICLERTIGQVVKSYESAANARAYWTNALFVDAVFNKNISAIDLIATRVDGLVPAEGERYKYANILGDALADILNYESAKDIMTIYPDDPCIIALAKAIYAISVQDAGNNYGKKKDKQKATEMILERTGGRKTEPTRNLLETKYVEPEWAKLPEGESDGQDTDTVPD